MKFRELLAGKQARLAPAVFNPLCAKLAEQAGFQLLYLSGGALGYIKCCLEANLSLPDVIQTGVEIRAACALPLIMDGVCGWGDPMHIGFTVKMAEAAGFRVDAAQTVPARLPDLFALPAALGLPPL